MYTGLLIKGKMAFESKQCAKEIGLQSSLVYTAVRYPSHSKSLMKHDLRKKKKNRLLLLVHWVTQTVK